MNQVLDIILLLVDNLDNCLVRALVGNQVADTNTECTRLHILRHNILKIINKLCRRKVSIVVACAVQQTLRASAKHSLIHLSANVGSIANLQDIVGSLGVIRILEQLGLVFQTQWGQDLTHNVKARNFLTLFQQLVLIHAVEHHQQIHRFARSKVDIFASELVRPQHRVLENSNNCRVVTGAHNLIWHCSQISKFCLRLRVLRHMQIHFISIELVFLKFPTGPEYTLCLIKLVRLSFETRNRLLSEPSPCSYHIEVRGLAADHPILHIITIGFGN